jgi:hypothetical protein
MKFIAFNAVILFDVNSYQVLHHLGEKPFQLLVVIYLSLTG